MDSTLHLFQEACRNFQEEAAQQFLSEFPQRSDAVWVSQQLLAQPLTAETHLYQFQAAIALRQSIALHWSNYNEDQQTELQNTIIQTILRLSEAMDVENNIQKLLCGIAAICLKLRWAALSSRAEFLTGVSQLIKGGTGLPLNCAGALLLQAVIEEFNGTTATPLGLSVDYHKQCTVAFQKQYLKSCFVECLQLVGWLVRSESAKTANGAATCFTAVRTLNAILSWDFDPTSIMGTRSAHSYDLRPRLPQASFRPDASWTEILTTEEMASWISQLLMDAPEMSSFSQNSLYTQEVQLFLLNLCSVSANTFPSDSEGKRSKRTFLKILLKQILQWLPLDSHLSMSPDALILVSKSLDALSRSHLCSEILSCVEYLFPRGTLLDRLRYLLNTLLDSGSMSPDRLDTSEQECCTKLLSIWQRFCTPEVYKIYKDVKDVALSQDIQDCAQDIFHHILSSEIQLATTNAIEEDEDPSMTEEELLMSYAFIGRASRAHSFQLLSHHLKDQQQNLIQLTHSGRSVSEMELEKTAFLAELAGCVLADDVYGEDPLVPVQLAEVSRNAASLLEDPVVQLSQSFLELSALILDTTVQKHLSGRVMECLLAGFVRWAETYLVPSDVTTPHLLQAFGDNICGQKVVQQLCAVANTCLTVFSSEQELQEIVCSRLLTTLTRSKEIRQQVIVCPAWMELLHAFAKMYPVFQSMPHKMARYIAHALCLGSDACADDSSRRQYLTELLDETRRALLRLTADGGMPMHGSYLLEILRGVTQAARSVPESRQILYDFSSDLMLPLLHLLSFFDFDEHFTCSILKLAAEMVDVHILFLAEAEAEQLLRWALEMLQQFSHHRHGLKPIEPSRLLQQEKEHEQCKDIRAMLLLLKNITDRELAAEEDSRYLDVAQIVLQGMDLTIPLMTTEMLKFPKLCFQYFDLLSHLSAIYPEKVSELPPGSLQTLMSTLLYGLTLPETRALRIVLESLESLAKYHWESLKKGNPGMDRHTKPGDVTFGALFIKAILQRLLANDEGGDAIAACSSSLVFLFFCEQDHVESLLQSIASSFGSSPAWDGHIEALLKFDAAPDPSKSFTQDAFHERFRTFIHTIATVIAWSKLPDLFSHGAPLTPSINRLPKAGSTQFYITQSAETVRRTQVTLAPTNGYTLNSNASTPHLGASSVATQSMRPELTVQATALINSSTEALMNLKRCPNCHNETEELLTDSEFWERIAGLEHNRLRCLRDIRQHMMSIFEPLFEGVKRVVLMDVALHTNMGDSILFRASVHTVALFGHSVNHVCFASQGAEKLYDTIWQFEYCDLNHIIELVKQDGLILYSGGGNWGNLYRYIQSYRMKALQLFAFASYKEDHNFTVVQLPQTVHYTRADDVSKDVDESLLNGLPKDFFTLFLRQQDSLDYAEKALGSTIRKQLVPDMAFALGNLLPIGEPEVDVLVLARGDDEEPEIDRAERDQVKAVLEAAGLSYAYRDWNYKPMNLEFSRSNPTVMSEVRLNEAVRIVSMGRVVITNRMHGSLLATMIGRTLLWVDTPQRKLAGVRQAAFDLSSACTDENLRSFEFPSVLSAAKAAVKYLTEGPNPEKLIADASFS